MTRPHKGNSTGLSARKDELPTSSQLGRKRDGVYPVAGEARFVEVLLRHDDLERPEAGVQPGPILATRHHQDQASRGHIDAAPMLPAHCDDEAEMSVVDHAGIGDDPVYCQLCDAGMFQAELLPAKLERAGLELNRIAFPADQLLSK